MVAQLLLCRRHPASKRLGPSDALVELVRFKFMQLIQCVTHLLLCFDQLDFQFCHLRAEDLQHLILLLKFLGKLVVLHVEVGPLHFCFDELILQVICPDDLISQL